MIRVVLDTNIIVSAAINLQGNEAKVVELVANRLLSLYASPPVLAEYREVLLRPELRLNPQRVHSLMKLVEAEVTLAAIST
ncbi:MAG: putative toxin-antitoxin system toxin component, PIN family [Acidobacteriota bacterium]